MIRDSKGGAAYWNDRVSYANEVIAKWTATLDEPPGDPSYRPQFVFGIAQRYERLMFQRYSRGDPIEELGQYFRPMLDYWEESERLGLEVYNAERQYTRHTWAVNYDLYVDNFWQVGLALALDIPDDLWNRLLVLIGNEGEDILLDRIIASRSPGRRIGTQLCFKRPYARLLQAVDAPVEQQPTLLREFVDHWYEEIGTIGKSGRAKQAVPYPHPYWWKLGNENFEGGAYFGRWCVEAVAAVKAFGMDDSLCLGHPNYPGDLLRPAGPSTHPARGSRKPVWLTRWFR